MAGKAKGPWFWDQRKRWCATIGGKRVVLDADNEKAAIEEWHRRMAKAPNAKAAGSELLAREVLRLHVDFVKDNREPLTYEWYVQHSKSFCKLHGALRASDVRPHHVDSWIASHEWAKSTRRGAISAIKIAFSWAKKRGHIEDNPLAMVEKPARSRRASIITAEQVDRFREEMKDGPFRDLFLVVMWTGCRPSEACKVEAKDFDAVAGTWTLHGKTTGVTGKKRVVYLPEEALSLCQALAKARPRGPLFLNAEGNPWNRHSYGHRVRRMRAKLGLGTEVVMSSLRHLFITDALVRGVPIASVAELAGHTSVAMVSEVYSMLHQRTDHLREAANAVRGVKSRDRTSPSDEAE